MSNETPTPDALLDELVQAYALAEREIHVGDSVPVGQPTPSVDARRIRERLMPIINRALAKAKLQEAHWWECLVPPEDCNNGKNEHAEPCFYCEHLSKLEMDAR